MTDFSNIKEEYSQNEVDSLVAFFQNRNWDIVASTNISSTLLRQSKKDGISVNKLIDMLSSLKDSQINELVASILNSEGKKSSLIGYRNPQTKSKYKLRNIVGI